MWKMKKNLKSVEPIFFREKYLISIGKSVEPIFWGWKIENQCKTLFVDDDEKWKISKLNVEPFTLGEN